VTTHTTRKCEMPPGGTKALFGYSTEHRARAGGTLGHLASRLHPREPSVEDARASEGGPSTVA